MVSITKEPWTMNDEITVLKAIAPEDCEPSPEVWLSARGKLASSIERERSALASSPPVATPDRVRPKLHHRRSLVLVGAAALVLAVSLLLSVSFGSSPRVPGGATSAAAAELNRLASTASQQPATIPAPAGSYLYFASYQSIVYTDGLGPSLFVTMLVPEDRSIWIASDGSGRLATTYGTPQFMSPKDEQNWVRAGSPPLSSLLPPVTDQTFGPHGLNGPDLSQASTDPETLNTQISNRVLESGPSGPGETFVQVGDFLRESDASPALRSALFQVAANIPGIEVLDSATDHSGQTGIGVALVQGGIQTEYIVDPSTSVLLGETETAVSADNKYQVPPGTSVGWATYQMSGVVVASTQAVPSS